MREVGCTNMVCRVCTLFGIIVEADVFVEQDQANCSKCQSLQEGEATPNSECRQTKS